MPCSCIFNADATAKQNKNYTMSLITLQCLEPKKNEQLDEFDALVIDTKQLDGACALQAMRVVTAAFHLNLVEELMKEHLVLLSF